ncbi:hypothetical protein Trydic_g23967 [Trypoxylus dichotomus]
MSIPEPLTRLFNEIDQNKSKYINNLKEAVAIPSVSAWPDKRPEIKRMVEWTAEKLKKLGVEVTLHDVGTQILSDGKKLPLPPVLFGTYKTGENKKTRKITNYMVADPVMTRGQYYVGFTLWKHIKQLVKRFR